MQTKENDTRISRRYRQNSGKRKRNVGYPFGYPAKTETAVTRQPVAGNDFLKETFLPVLGSMVGAGLSKQVRDEKGNSEFLFACARKYFQLMGKSLEVQPSGMFTLDCYNLYLSLRKVLPPHIGINFDLYGERIAFYLFYDEIKFPGYTLFFFPVCGVENMEPRIAEVFIHFLAFIRREQGISLPEEHDCIDYFISDFGEYENMEEDDLETDFVEMRKRYRDGDINSWMSEIDEKYLPKPELLELLNRLYLYDFTHMEDGVIDIMVEGTYLLSEDRIMNYDYFPKNSIQSDYDSSTEDTVPFDRKFCFCWGFEDTDKVTYYAVEMYNTDCQELTDYNPADYTVLTPDTDKIFTPSDWPTRFADWFRRFIHILENYI